MIGFSRSHEWEGGSDFANNIIRRKLISFLSKSSSNQIWKILTNVDNGEDSSAMPFPKRAQIEIGFEFYLNRKSSPKILLEKTGILNKNNTRRYPSPDPNIIQLLDSLCKSTIYFLFPSKLFHERILVLVISNSNCINFIHHSYLRTL